MGGSPAEHTGSSWDTWRRKRRSAGHSPWCERATRSRSTRPRGDASCASTSPTLSWRRATRAACWRNTPGSSPAAVREPSPMREDAGGTGGTVAIQGEAGSFSHAAALETHGPALELVPCPTFVDLFRAVEAGDAASGIVPIENTLAGSVHENYDLLSAHELHVVAETELRIRHCLIAPP